MAKTGALRCICIDRKSVKVLCAYHAQLNAMDNIYTCSETIQSNETYQQSMKYSMGGELGKYLLKLGHSPLVMAPNVSSTHHSVQYNRSIVIKVMLCRPFSYHRLNFSYFPSLLSFLGLYLTDAMITEGILVDISTCC